MVSSLVSAFSLLHASVFFSVLLVDVVVDVVDLLPFLVVVVVVLLLILLLLLLLLLLHIYLPRLLL